MYSHAIHSVYIRGRMCVYCTVGIVDFMMVGLRLVVGEFMGRDLCFHWSLSSLYRTLIPDPAGSHASSDLPL